MRGSEDMNSSPVSSNWIYIGADIYNRIWSKVGMTANGLDTRHRSPQNPGYFIYTAFNIVRGNVCEIEKELLEHLGTTKRAERFVHFSTGNLSECFRLNPRETTYLVEEFIKYNFGSSVTYETSLDGDMSRYQCRYDIRRYYDDFKPQSFSSIPQPNTLSASSYYTGNQEVHEINLGGGHYLDVATCEIRHIDDKS